MPAGLVSSPTEANVNVSPSSASTTVTTASLLPVNPFPRKDLNPRTISTVPPSPGMSGDCESIISVRGHHNQISVMEVPKSGGIMSPVAMDIRSIQSPFIGQVPTMNSFFPISESTTVQTEALDFSMKSRASCKENHDLNDLKIDCSDSKYSEAAVDLSCRNHNMNNADEDRKLMLEEYHTQLHNGDAHDKTSAKVSAGTKRSTSFLDKMVDKLWQTKIARRMSDDTSNEPKVLEIKPESPGHINENSSLGRVYVLNDLPDDGDPVLQGQFPVNGPKNASDSAADDLTTPETGICEARPGEEIEKSFCSIKFHTCRVCKQLFYSAEEMWEHAVTHEDFHKYRCTQCTYVTACHRELVNHKLLNHGVDLQKNSRFICNFPGCMRSYSEWRHLKEHQKAHDTADDNTLPVTTSSRIIKSPSRTPMGSPTKNGRLVCDYAGCYKTFKEWRHLKVHQTLHTGEKPLSCQLCNYACRHRSSMNWHMKSKHGLDKMKTQGNRTVYVDSNRRVICGWCDEANKEINYLTYQPEHGQKQTVPEIKPDIDGSSDYSSVMSDIQSPESGLAGGCNMDGSVSFSESSRPPSCAPSDNPSERSLPDDPQSLMMKMQTKQAEFPLNMSVHIEALSPNEQMVGQDGKIGSKTTLFPFNYHAKQSPVEEMDVANSSPYAYPTGPSSLPSYDVSPPVQSEGRTLVMTPVAAANFGQEGSNHQSSMMKFKLKYLVAPKFYPCNVCNENFDNASNMWKHRLHKHKECTRFFCDNCTFVADQMPELQEHMLSTHGKEMGGMKDHICFICGKGYATKTGLNQHLLRHSEEGPPLYECPYENCASKVHSKCALKNHIRRVHLKVPAKPQGQEQGCEKRFDSSSAQRNQQSPFSEQRPLTCDYDGCDKTFRESKHLKVHRMQHTDEKPISCEHCDYSCRQRNSMNWHMKSKHSHEKSVSPDGRTVLANAVEQTVWSYQVSDPNPCDIV